ncbi:flagellar hook-associated protein FlgL [Scopulibacillus cellulosilyticus]|uniref:Flagellar hook-associated protein FlgL n=1 Tax=Scopulibacillus cellulosilyticus TaxID=2665665 RepID=A0ABW2Q2Z5_9BACL
MRVTQGMMSQNILRQLGKSYEKIAQYQQQLASGKKITRPSQDPVVAVMGISYRGDVNHVEQFKRNLSEAHKWLDTSDGNLDQVNQVLQRVRELTVEASNDTYNAEQRKAVNDEIDQLKQQLTTIGNQQVGGKYIFNGQRTDQKPLNLNEKGEAVGDPPTYISKVDVTFKGADPSTNHFSVEVNDGINVDINVDPNSVFNQGLFDDLDALQKKLLDPSSSSQDISSFLGKIDQHLDEVGSARSELGAKMNRIDMLDNRLDQQQEIAEKVMSNNEDADFEKVIINLTQQESVYRAALSVGGQIMQPSLVDFIK